MPAVAVGEDDVPHAEGPPESVEADVWIVEPIDIAGLDHLLAALVTVAGGSTWPNSTGPGERLAVGPYARL